MSHQVKRSGPIEKPQPRQKSTKRLKAKPRSKGNRAEREVIDILQAHGYPARRNFQSGGQGGGDILGGPDGFHIEVKHRERCSVWEWIEQADSERRPTETPAVIFRRNHSEWMACIPFADLLGLIEASQL